MNVDDQDRALLLQCFEETIPPRVRRRPESVANQYFFNPVRSGNWTLAQQVAYIETWVHRMRPSETKRWIILAVERYQLRKKLNQRLMEMSDAG